MSVKKCIFAVYYTDCAMVRKLLSAILMLIAVHAAGAQEFRCAVQVNHQKLTTNKQKFESSDTRIFESMKQALETFINGRAWTNLEFGPQELIDCSLSLVLTERNSPTDFKGQLSVQMRRPVYNSTYTTGLLNRVEQADLQFSYNESQPFEFDPNTFYDNLSSAVAFYMYVMLGMYFDSYSPMGGTPFYEVARSVAQQANQAGYVGWNASGDVKARYWYMENHVNSAYRQLRNAYYVYHRQGLDMMTKDQPQARAGIIAALADVAATAEVRHNLPAVTQFADVKMAEIISIFTPAPPAEKKQVFELVRKISPLNVAKIQSWNTQ